MSFYHNVFAREHNPFVERVPRARPPPRRTPTPACAIPRSPTQVIRYRDVTADELFEAARLVVVGRDRQDPHHRVDAAAALRRAAVSRHERQLERPVPWPASWCRPRWSRSPSTTSASRPTRRRPRSGTRSSPPAPASSASAAACTPTTRSSRPTIRARPTCGASRTPTTSTAASTTSARRSTSRRSSSPSIACTRWCPTSSSTASGTPTPTRSANKVPVVDTFRGRGHPGHARARPGQLGALAWAGSAWAC